MSLAYVMSHDIRGALASLHVSMKIEFVLEFTGNLFPTIILSNS
jgi:hypothetical protein